VQQLFVHSIATSLRLHYVETESASATVASVRSLHRRCDCTSFVSALVVGWRRRRRHVGQQRRSSGGSWS
jgi:hypothetical protein